MASDRALELAIHRTYCKHLSGGEIQLQLHSLRVHLLTRVGI